MGAIRIVYRRRGSHTEYAMTAGPDAQHLHTCGAWQIMASEVFDWFLNGLRLGCGGHLVQAEDVTQIRPAPTPLPDSRWQPIDSAGHPVPAASTPEPDLTDDELD